MRIEDLAIIGDTQTIAIVARDGTIPWLCLPRFDSGACFASLLGSHEHGQWRIAPRGGIRRIERRYRRDSLVLETDFVTETGTVRVVDAMPIRGRTPDVVRVIEGVEGSVDVHVELVLRFDYGRAVPWMQRTDDGRLVGIVGPDAIVLASPIRLRGEHLTSVADVTVRKGNRVPFVLTWYPSHERPPKSPDALAAVEETDRFWRDWASRCRDEGPYRDAIMRSLITLKALTYAPTGGIVAAGTTSLPEDLGGVRNWDYRYCWLRDAAFALYALLHAGYHEEALAWRDWLLRAVAGEPSALQIMYGAAGERHLDERTLDWLPGYEGSRPVRIGNAAAGQLQLDVYGEVLDTFHQARRLGVTEAASAWPLQRAIADWLESNWTEPDEGLWEVRSERRHFTYSKVMAWVALDRVVKAVEQHGRDGDVARWRATRDAIHEDVCRRGFDPALGSFTQAYGTKDLDASLLLIPSVGFLPPEDPRIIGTVRAIEENLVEDGFVLRYPTHDATNLDGLPGHDGAFLACSFWLADAYDLIGRREDSVRLFERLLTLRNDVGLLSEEYDPRNKRLIGNFPQAFSHVALISTARNLVGREGPSRHRKRT